MARIARDERRRGVRVQLGERDVQLLHALARFRLARTSDLVALLFDGVRRDTATARLRLLFDAGYLDVREAGRSTDNLYTLGEHGRKVVIDAGGSVHVPPRAGLDHHLAVVRAWVDLAVAVRRSQCLRLESFRPDWEIREHASHKGLAVMPDGIGRLRAVDGGGDAIAFALEVDRGRESMTALRAKLASYEQQILSPEGLLGARDLGLLVVLDGASPKRRTSMTELFESAWSGWWMLWESSDEACAALQSIAAALMPPLAASPVSKGSPARVTDDSVVDSYPQGEGVFGKESRTDGGRRAP